MIREIHLATGLYDNRELTLADNEKIVFKIVGRIQPNLTYYIKVKNGGFYSQKRFIDNLVEFERKDLVYGKLQAKIVAMANESIVKEIEVEDLILKEINDKMRTIPEFEILKQEFDRVRSENEAMKQKIAELEELCENTKELVIRLNNLTEKVGA